MENNKISLAIFGNQNSNSGFQPLYWINDPPQQLENIVPPGMDENPYFFTLQVLPTHTQYTLIQNRVSSYMSVRPGVLKMAIAIPQGYNIHGDVSPLEVLLKVRQQFIDSCMTLRDAHALTYNYREKLPHPEIFTSIINDYQLTAADTTLHLTMAGTEDAVMLLDEKAVSVLFRAPQHPEFQSFRSIVIAYRGNTSVYKTRLNGLSIITKNRTHMEIKNVRINEIHWSLGWNASQEANKRLKDKIGETCKYFAQLKVGNATYNWMADAVGKWLPMGMAPDSDKRLIMEKTEGIRQEVFAKLPGEESLAEKICQVPNYEEYIYYKDNSDGSIDVVITGWGFHNFKKSGVFVESWPPRPARHTTTIAFIINGERQPLRPFSIVTPKMQKPDATDEQGLRSYNEYAGLTITVIDSATQRQFTFVTEDRDNELEFDVTPEPVPTPEPEPVCEPEPVPEPEPKPEPVTATLTVLDAQSHPLAGAACHLQQGATILELTLDEKGTAPFQQDTFAVGQPLQAYITTKGQQQSPPIEFTLDDGELEYVLQENGSKGGNNLIGFLVGLLILAALAAGVIFGLKPGVEELTKIINKNLF